MATETKALLEGEKGGGRESRRPALRTRRHSVSRLFHSGRSSSPGAALRFAPTPRAIGCLWHLLELTPKTEKIFDSSQPYSLNGSYLLNLSFLISKFKINKFKMLYDGHLTGFDGSPNRFWRIHPSKADCHSAKY